MKLSWKDVLYPHSWFGSIDNISKMAKRLNYKYFSWNDVVYRTEDNHCIGLYRECGLDK